ncbi:Clp protease N-terminal domain-containing protein [Streptomyces swartbergensis]|uniref:Peptidase n=1 Tax=Streptomyces swartbergensis TaxID=487165 RepID=A0A243S1I3_9ACTN|nr:Clp protease N-terminal domain-containing protein [Streptomyces swartbergensis]OUD01397.1 peptidase [Streptomyces swartbergensis]
MFERFTKDARSVVKGAFEYVEGGGGGQVVEPEHLLLALLDREGSRGSFALAALGLGERRESVRQALGAARRRAGLSQAETDALAGLGIDVEEIVARVEEVHGAGAMAGDRKSKAWWSGRASFGRGAKDVLERSLRVALAQGDRHIGDEHILLSLTMRPGVPAEVLADHGVTYESLVRVLYGGGEAKAG